MIRRSKVDPYYQVTNQSQTVKNKNSQYKTQTTKFKRLSSKPMTSSMTEMSSSKKSANASGLSTLKMSDRRIQRKQLPKKENLNSYNTVSYSRVEMV